MENTAVEQKRKKLAQLVEHDAMEAKFNSIAPAVKMMTISNADMRNV